MKGEATGHFHIGEINERISMVTPEGHAFFSLGVCHIVAISRHHKEEPDLFAERYGRDWEAFATAELDWALN